MSSRPSRGAARLAAILDALPDGLVLVNANGTVVNANSIALEMFETPGTALVGRGLLDLLPEFDSKLIPGSMRRPDSADARGRTKPTRMVARRTDSTEFPAEVTSASLEDGRDAYNDIHSYTGDELLMLVVRDLSGTMDTEAELARSQRQTEMILRAASEGVVGTDTDGRVVLVNPAAAQILGFRATDLGGRELHTLILHSRADGEPFPYADSPLADTLRSGRKHRVRGQVLWAKNGSAVPVDLTTAPVRDGEQLVGAVMTFTDRRAHEELLEQHTKELKDTTDGYEAKLAETTERLTTELAGTEQRLTTQLTGTTERFEAELAEAAERHAAELADRSDRYAAEIEELAERYGYIAARHAQLTAVLGDSLRGPLLEMRGELTGLAADPAGQLWPEANQILHHLAAGYARMTTLVDNVLGYQRLDAGLEVLTKTNVLLDAVVAAGVEGAIELIGPGRAQFAVHAPPIEAQVDAGRLATALAHLVADVAGVDSTGRTRVVPGGGYVDSTIVVAAAQRGDVVRIEVRGPFAGGDPVHEPIVRGIVRAHGGVLQTHEVPGMGGSAYVLELPLGEGAGTVPPPGREGAPAQQPAPGSDVGAGMTVTGSGTAGGRRRRARRASTDAFLDSPTEEAGEPTGRRRARVAGPDTGDAEDAAGSGGSVGAGEPAGGTPHELIPSQAQESIDGPNGGTGRRRGRPNPAEGTGNASGGGAPGGAGIAPVPAQGTAQPAARAAAQGSPPGSALALSAGSSSQGSVVTSAEGSHPTGRAARGAAVPPQGVPPEGAPGASGTGRRARHSGTGNGGGQSAMPALPPGLPAPGPTAPGTAPGTTAPPGAAVHAPAQARPPAASPPPAAASTANPTPTGRRTRRALAPAQERHTPVPAAPEGARSPFALPPADADRAPSTAPGTGTPAAAPGPVGPGAASPGRHDAVRTPPDADYTPPQPHPVSGVTAPADPSGWAVPGGSAPAAAPGAPAPGPVGQDSTSSGFGMMTARPGWPDDPRTIASEDPAADGGTSSGPAPAQPDPGSTGADDAVGVTPPAPPRRALPSPGVGHHPLPPAQPLPEEAPVSSDSTQGRAFSVRTLGQGVPFAAQPQGPVPGRPPSPSSAPVPAQSSGQGQSGNLGSGRRRKLGTPPDGEPPESNGRQHSGSQGGSRLTAAHTEGRSYAIGAPDEGAEGPQPLDGPGGAVEVANRPQPQPVDDELPPEPLDNPRRLLVWPAPDVSTSQALSDRGYRPVVVHSREEVDAQIAAFPAALFVDPLTGPITRTALQSLRQAAVAAEVPVLVTAGLGQATREAAYGADPAVLLKALAPRDSEQHPSRVLLIEEHEEIAGALTATLERRGLQVARAGNDNEAVTLAAQMRPNLVVMDLMQVRRRRAGIIDWLRANGQLNRTPLVVYTSVGINAAELTGLASGETVLFLAERSTSDDVQARIVELLAKIGTN